MARLCFYDGTEWIPLYEESIEDALHKSANLSDLPDKAAALAALGLSGNTVATHQHDDVYLPLITAEHDAWLAAVNTERGERIIRDTDIFENLDTRVQELESITVASFTSGSYPVAPELNTSLHLNSFKRRLEIFAAICWSCTGAKVAWSAGLAAELGQCIVESGYAFECIQNGNTAGTKPVFSNVSINQSIVDGQSAWKAIGPYTGVWAPNTYISPSEIRANAINSHLFRCTAHGTTGPTEPVFATGIGVATYETVGSWIPLSGSLA